MQIVSPNVIRRLAIASGMVALLGASQLAVADAGSDLAAKKSCMACHKLAEKSIGPAFKDIAKKYKGSPDAEATLIAKIKQGGKGVWGKASMPAQKSLSDEELKTLASWILSQS